MRAAASDLGRRALAIGILLIAAWILLKIVIGVVTAVATTVIAILAVLAILWAISALR